MRSLTQNDNRSPRMIRVRTMRVVHLGRSTCHTISGRGDESTRIPDNPDRTVEVPAEDDRLLARLLPVLHVLLQPPLYPVLAQHGVERRERENRLHSPFALHAPIQWAI